MLVQYKQISLGELKCNLKTTTKGAFKKKVYYIFWFPVFLNARARISIQETQYNNFETNSKHISIHFCTE